MCVKIRALCNKNYSEQSNYQLSPSHQLALQWLHFRCCLQGQFKVLLQGKKFFLFWTWALVGLISLSEINKYWLSATSAHDTRLSLYSWHSTPGLWMPFSHLLSLASSGRKKKNEISGNFSSAHSPPASWPTGQAPGSRDSQTLYFSGFFLFHEDFIF